MPLTPEWANFFMAELAALAALTGFVVVAISINLTRILSYAGLANRAGEALIAPVGAITATSLVLIPEQPSWLLGGEVLAIGLVMVIAPIVFQARSWRDRKDATAVERIAQGDDERGLQRGVRPRRRARDRRARAPVSTGSPPATSPASSPSSSTPGC